MTTLYFVLGLLGLFLGGNGLVQGAAALAERFRVPPLVIGLTIVGFGTSTPELLVSVNAALDGLGGIAIGNVIGSNSANILLILGLSAVVGGLAAPFVRLRSDLAWMLGAAVAMVPVLWDGSVGRIEGLVLVAALAVYVGLAFLQVGSTHEAHGAVMPLGKAVLFLVGGLVLLLIGARLLVDSATEIARAFGVSEAVIGLTIVAVGTSLPELATSVAAAVKGQREIAIGNVIGSNIFNILGILGLSAVVAPLAADPRFLAVDAPVMICVSLLLAGIVALTGRIGRATGVGLLAAYAVYVGLMA
jgi:cation:H+ antiporter